MPEIVKFYAESEPLLPNVETWRCREPDALKYVLDHLDEVVVKLVDGSGGYGMLVGPTASKAEIEDFRRVLANACFWCLGMEAQITPKADLALPPGYAPGPVGAKGLKAGVRPEDLR